MRPFQRARLPDRHLAGPFTAAEDSYGGPALVLLTNGFWDSFFRRGLCDWWEVHRLSGNS